MDGTGLVDKKRTVADSADEIRIFTNSYEMYGSMRIDFTHHPKSP